MRGYAGRSVRRRRASRLRSPHETGSELAGDLSNLVGLDHVALLHVLEVLDPDAALVPLGDLPHVVLEPPERADPAVVHDHAVAYDPGARVANDRPVDDHAPGDDADPRDPEGRADLGPAEVDLPLLGREHPAERRADVV